MMELSKRIEELLEKHDFNICGEITERYGDKGRYDIELETYSPEGEDVIVSLIYDGTEESFISAFVEYANGFDAEEHAEMWIEWRGKRGVPESIKDLLEDAEWIENTLLEVAEALNNIEEETEELSNMINGFNKNGFMSWLKEEFPGVIDTHWNYGLVENILNYALRDEVSKDQFAYFVSDILPEVEFLEVARFCDSKYLTDGTIKQLEQSK